MNIREDDVSFLAADLFHANNGAAVAVAPTADFCISLSLADSLIILAGSALSYQFR